MERLTNLSGLGAETPMLDIIVPTMHRRDLLRRFVASIDRGPVALWLATNAPPEEDLLRLLECAPGRVRAGTQTYDPENRGVAASWNWGLRSALAHADWALVCGDDVVLGPGAIDAYAKAMANGCAMAVGPEGVGMACFAISRACWETVGEFDENCHPAFCEDFDYHRRMKLAGLDQTVLFDVKLQHDISSTVRSLPPGLQAENRRTWRENVEYVQRKWGTVELTGGYPTPFNDPKLGVKDWTLDVERRERLRWRAFS